MRQNNQNKRVRGRGRKGPNPLSRSYESNGPDVKVRGTALHVAEKYVQLARDAQASGDRVIAENYLQHAEHYFRIIAAQGQIPQQSASQRDDDRDGDYPLHGQSGGGSSERRNGNGTVMPADAPQPFVDAPPGVNTKATNGGGVADEAEDADDVPSEDDVMAEAEDAGAEAADAANGEDGDDAAKPRRRARTPRAPRSRTPRRTSRASAEDEGAASEGAGGAPVEAKAEAAVSDEAVTPEA